MSQLPKIEVDLTGPNGSAELTDFTTVVNALRNSLRNVSRCVAGDSDAEFLVSNLRYGSAVVEVAPTDQRSPDLSMEIATTYCSTLHALQNDLPIDHRIDYAALHAFNGYASVAKKNNVSLDVGGQRLTTRFAGRVSSLLEPDLSCLGSVTGLLHGLHLHGRNEFVLYPPLASEHVDCKFARSDLDEVLEAVDSNVTVYGTLHYAKTKVFPVRVDVDSFEKLPPEDELPTLLNACGSMHSTQDSVSMIREIRNEWQ